MFLKKTKSKNVTYLKIVESYWDKQQQKSKQKVVVNLGRLDFLLSNGLIGIVDNLSQIVERETKSSGRQIKKKSDLKDITTMKEIIKAGYGFIIYRKLWKRYDLDKLLSSILKNKKTEFDFVSVVFSMVINQLLNPSSKLKLWVNKDKYLKINEEIELQHYYRSLDILAENKETIELKLFEKNCSLFNLKLDIVFYDVTTFYFESQVSDELKDFGFDKDNKINNVHIVMGLLVDRDGKPIGYELFKGNTYEGHTLLKFIEKLKKRFQIGTIVIVADKGLNSKMNLKQIKEAGYDYIVSGRLRSMKKQVKEMVINSNDYLPLTCKELSFLDPDDKDNIFKYKVIDYENEIRYKEEPNDKKYKKIKLQEKLVCTYSSKRASKDKKDRERMLEKANEIIMNNEKSKIENRRGHKKYVAKQYAENINADDYKLVLNQAKIKEDEKYDGYYVLQSSRPDLQAKEIIENYHYLFKIEESFRIMKSTMQVRPVNHWTPKRIEGHFVMSFLAFLLERELEYRLLKNKKTKAPEKIKEAINSMVFTKISIENKIYYLRSNHNKLASEILAMLKIKQAGHLLNQSQLEKYMNIELQT